MKNAKKCFTELAEDNSDLSDEAAKNRECFVALAMMVNTDTIINGQQEIAIRKMISDIRCSSSFNESVFTVMRPIAEFTNTCHG